MALRDKLRARAQPLLEPGEKIQQAFLAQTGPDPNLVFLTWLVLFLAKYFVVVATDRNIVVFRARMWLPAGPREVVVRLPRETTIGPTSGALWSKVSIMVNGKPLWVHRRFYKDVQAGDEEHTTDQEEPGSAS